MKKRKKNTHALFNPDCIANAVHQALICDLSSSLETSKYPSEAQLLYCKTQTEDFLKKYVSTSNQARNQDELEKESLQNFIDNIRRLESGVKTKLFSFDVPNVSFQSQDVRTRVLLRARDISRLILEDIDEDEWFKECKNSHGTSIGLSFSSTELEDKFLYPLSCTNATRVLFERYLKWDPQLRAALNRMNGLPDHHEILYAVQEESRTTTVEKDDKSRRIIAIETTLCMFFQQGLMALMTRRLHPYLDLRIAQVNNSNAAFVSSITHQSGTIDWSKASDCVLTELVMFCFSPRWFGCLDLVRHKSTSIKGSIYELPMLSTMGNATTFPVETILFYAFAVATHIETQNKRRSIPIWDDFKSVLVFGDDCIVPSESCELYISIMESVGFVVNKKKTFIGTEGFRESCGSDFFQGRNVRPYYLRSPVNNRKSSLEPWLYTIWNRILSSYFKYYGPTTYVYTSALYLLSDLFNQNGIKIKLVPDDFPDDAGLKAFGDLARVQLILNKNKFSTIKVDKHGTVVFNFCKFQYRTSEVSKIFQKKDPSLRFWDTLKFNKYSPMLKTKEYFVRISGNVIKIHSSPVELLTEVDFTTMKKKGGYVVARSKSFMTDFIKNLCFN